MGEQKNQFAIYALASNANIWPVATSAISSSFSSPFVTCNGLGGLREAMHVCWGLFLLCFCRGHTHSLLKYHSPLNGYSAFFSLSLASIHMHGGKHLVCNWSLQLIIIIYSNRRWNYTFNFSESLWIEFEGKIFIIF